MVVYTFPNVNPFGIQSDMGGGGRPLFRGQRYKDIDILVVASPSCKDHLGAYYEFRTKIESIGVRLSVVFDITFLTSREFEEKPLIEMDFLIEIFRRPLPTQCSIA